MSKAKEIKKHVLWHKRKLLRRRNYHKHINTPLPVFLLKPKNYYTPSTQREERKSQLPNREENLVEKILGVRILFGKDKKRIVKERLKIWLPSFYKAYVFVYWCQHQNTKMFDGELFALTSYFYSAFNFE